MELDEIKKLIELLNGTEVTELQLEREGVKLKIKKEKFLSSYEVSPPFAGPARTESPAAVPVDDPRFVKVSSPIVGLFYSAPSPESPPFADVGTYVKKGQVLCIVEAMKLMNEIESDTDGTVAKVFVENGQPVEYGEPLFLIEPS
jgi:acetyl-CoA carboxylase biotin carboxyl carrier protein